MKNCPVCADNTRFNCTANNYRGISHSGHSEIRTISLQRTQLEVPRYKSPKERILLTKDKNGVPKCHLFGDVTVTVADFGPPVMQGELSNLTLNGASNVSDHRHSKLWSD